LLLSKFDYRTLLQRCSRPCAEQEYVKRNVFSFSQTQTVSLPFSVFQIVNKKRRHQNRKCGGGLGYGENKRCQVRSVDDVVVVLEREDKRNRVGCRCRVCSRVELRNDLLFDFSPLALGRWAHLWCMCIGDRPRHNFRNLANTRPAAFRRLDVEVESAFTAASGAWLEVPIKGRSCTPRAKRRAHSRCCCCAQWRIDRRECWGRRNSKTR